MSHELRTPLNAIIGFSELLEQEIDGPLTEGQRSSVNDVLTSGRHLLQLVNDILDLSKIEAGKMDHAPRWTPLGAIVGGVQSVLRPLADKGGIALHINLGADVPEVFVDAVRIKQVLYNLLSNGIKFTPAGGSVSLDVSADGRALTFVVKDSGIGIAAADLPRLFQEFEQIEPARGVKPEGTGLGLVLTRRFVEAHGGSITVSSEVNCGTTFTVTLPLTRRTGAQAIQP
jgi:signal transduction histidine kinase